ncbi:hypothetical protein [Bradyrhizobium sp. sGM-13]|uniref:hypothetical protein n=1 Tax=Bradyrhizobium sp. sGM-13 TaxID=2831781 RepID=UPI0020C10F4F|nr:hypothetical protein [Bradyrhizobium sp. sGM-13]
MHIAMNMRDAARNGIRKLWSWLHDASWTIGRYANENKVCSDEVISRAAAAKNDLQPVSPVAGRGHAAQSGILLQFPVRGEALLVRLADLLRSRIADRRLERDPLLLLISRCPGSRLSIDRSAYVEFLADRCTYYVAIEAQPDTRVTVETADFDTVVKFVVQYVAERLSEKVLLEAAS